MSEGQPWPRSPIPAGCATHSKTDMGTRGCGRGGRNNHFVNSTAAPRPYMAAPVYRPLRYLGQGTFGVVILAEEMHTGKKVAIKRVQYDARQHNREVNLLKSVLVDDPRPPSSADQTRGDGSSQESRDEALPPVHTASSCLGEGKSNTVHLWSGTHHPNIVELLDSYVTYQSTEGEPATTAGKEINSNLHLFSQPFRQQPLGKQPFSVGVGSRNFPLAASAASASSAGPAYLEMVMSYLPMDLSGLEKFYFRFHRMPHISPPSSPSTSAFASTNRGAESVEKTGAESAQTCCSTVPETTRRASSGSSRKISATVSSNSSSCCSSPGPTSYTCLPLRWVKVVLFQLARALAFMHARHVCHRDLKPANILVDPSTGRMQLCDFGSAKQVMHPDTEKNVSYICSRYYRAPELLFGALHYGCAVDMWSFGCIVAELLREAGRPLFRGCTSVDQMAELFKVLGAPSKREMYAMNPQCAEALLRTHAMHQHSLSRVHTTGHRDESDVESLGEDEEDGGIELHSCEREKVYGMPHHEDDFFHDVLEEAEVVPSPASSSAADMGRYRDGHFASPPSRCAADAKHSPHITTKAVSFDRYYDVLRVRAIPWQKLLPVGTQGEAVALVASLLCYTPSKRLTAVEVVEHPFFDELFAASDAAQRGLAEQEKAESPLRLHAGALLPLAMFQVTEVERSLYTDAFLSRMARQAELVAMAAATEQG